jgi:nucleoside-diphosphate-sugar epimerase
MKKILITGAGGFIGRHCLPLLLKDGYEVHAAEISTNHLACAGVNWHQVDLLGTKNIDELFSSIRPTHLLHLAWYTEHKTYWTSLKNHDWVSASLALIKSFRNYGGKRAVFAGTCAEYDWGAGICSEDTTPLIPITLYGNCKNDLRKELEDFSNEEGLSSAWARIFFAYGPAEHPHRLVSSVIASLLEERPVFCSAGKQKRDFLYVEDIASAFVSILESHFEGAINIGSGIAISIEEVINIIADKIGRPDLIEFDKLPASSGEPPLLIADTTKIKEKVRWSARYDLRHGLDKTICWWRDYLRKE